MLTKLTIVNKCQQMFPNASNNKNLVRGNRQVAPNPTQPQLNLNSTQPNITKVGFDNENNSAHPPATKLPARQTQCQHYLSCY